MRRILVIGILLMVALTGCLDEAPELDGESGSQVVTVVHGSEEVNQRIQEFQLFRQNVTAEQQAGNITFEEAQQRIQTRQSEVQSEVMQIQNESIDNLTSYIENSDSIELQDTNANLFLVEGDSTSLINLLERDNVRAILSESEFQPQQTPGLPAAP